MFDRKFREMLMMDYATQNQNGVLDNSNNATNGLLSTNNSGLFGGLQNVNPNIMLGATIAGAGLQGQNPFTAFSDSLTKTAQLNKLLTPKTKSSFRQLTDKEKADRGLPQDKQFQIDLSNNKVTQVGGSGTTVNVNQKQETTEQKEYGKVFAKEFEAINEAGNLAIVNDAKLDTLLELTQMESLNSGTFGPLRTEVQKFAEEFGFDPGLQNTTVAEVIQGTSGGLVLDGLQKFSGSISDGERTYTASITPGLSMTKEGNRVLLEISKRQNALAKEFQNVASNWIQENEGLSKKNKDGQTWADYKVAWQKANPLINPEMKAELSALAKRVDSDFEETVITNKKGQRFVYINGEYHRIQ